jgi:hypothetical protein
MQFGEEVKQKAPSCEFRNLYESAGQNMAVELRLGRVRQVTFTVARGGKIPDTVSIETIQYS